MKSGSIVPLVLLSAGASVGGSCSAISQEQLLANEQSRVQQERKGYLDRENSEQLRKADELTRQEKLRRKNRQT